MVDLCNLDGAITSEADARIPVLDRGFLFGDSVYEVMRTRSRIPFAWAQHIARLRQSAAAIRLDLGIDDRELMARVAATIEQAGPGEKYARIIVTRGTGSAPNIDLSFATGAPRAVILVRDLPAGLHRTARVAVIPRLRTDRRALDPAIKSGNYLNNVLGLAEAKAAGATDCLFLNADGVVTEASTANVFAFRGDRLVTPPLSAGLLAGITRGLLFRCAREHGIAVDELELTGDDVRAADEVFLSSTLRDISPVTHLDGSPIGAGETGPRTARLIELFAAFVARKSAEEDGPALRRLLG